MPRSELESSISNLLARQDVRAAAEQLVRAYGSEVLGLCAQLVRDRSLAEDLAQDAFSRAFGGLDGFRGDASLRTWLLAITRNVCLDHLRRHRHAARLLDDGEETDEQPDLTPLLSESLGNLQQLSHALDVLDESDRALVLLRYGHGLDYAEVAEVFGIKPGTARMRLCRALERMRSALAELEGDGLPRARARSIPPRSRRDTAPSGLEAEPSPEARALGPASAPEFDIRAPGGPRRPDAIEPVFRSERVQVDARPESPEERAFARLLERIAPPPSAERLARRLEPGIRRLGGRSSGIRRLRAWYARLFDRS